MVYDWNDKQEICHRLYVEEQKPLDEVMRYLKEVHGFDPSKRAFQTQFRRWNFPSKHNPAYRNEPLVARIKELWEANTSQREMSRILRDEGYNIKDRELMRVRAKNRWLLRVPNGTKSFGPVLDFDPQSLSAAPPDSRNGTTADELTSASIWSDKDPNRLAADDIEALEHAMLHDEEPEPDQAGPTDSAGAAQPKSQPGSPETFPTSVAEKKKQRMAELEAESAELWATKKRRRRTRGYGGLPADPPGPPRFPSETTLDESKAFLHLDNTMYRVLREQFQSICEDIGFVKKTIAGPEKWQAAKDRLIKENDHLNRQFFGAFNGVPTESKSLALDVVCTDVTKRMRTDERRMTIADAKNLLQINPEQSRRVRNEFYQILKQDHFTSKLEAGSDRWKELKQQWIQTSPVLNDVLSSGELDPNNEEKLKAIEILARDVMKRLRDNTNRRDPSKKKAQGLGPGPGPMGPQWTAPSSKRLVLLSSPVAPTTSTSPSSAITTTANTTTTTKGKRARPNNSNFNIPANDTLQIDPTLLAAAADSSLAEQLQRFAASAEGASAFAESTPALTNVTQAAPSPSSSAVAVLFRLSPASPIQSGPKVWLGTLGSASIAELHQRASQNRPEGVTVLKIEGVISDQAGSETLFPIDRDDELDAYLQYVTGATGKVQFVVRLGEGFPL